MTLDASLKTINCTSCGAGLDVLGGGRVTTHICPYCGSMLDAQHDYDVLRKFSQLKRPDSPFTIGTTGTLYGVEWTVIGMLEHSEAYRGVTYTWIDHQLYSPTHGYAWLTLENGHLSFARKVRGLGSHVWMTPTTVETADHPPVLQVGGERFKYFETSDSYITFAEGEFTWTPDFNNPTRSISTLSDTAMLDFSETAKEREIHKVTYLNPADTCKAFGIDPSEVRPKGFNVLKPYREWVHFPFIRYVSVFFAVLCFVFAMFMSIMPGDVVLADQEISVRHLPRSYKFDITQVDRLAGITIRNDASNSWGYVELELTGPDDETLFEAGRTMEYYFGRDSEGRWTEGNRSTSLYFRPEQTGQHVLSVTQPESGTWGSGGKAPTRLWISAREGMSSGFWLVILGLGFSVIAILGFGLKAMHAKRRWAQSDWYED